MLMERIFCLHEKHHALFSCKLRLRKQLSFLGEKEKEMFTRELAPIEDLERSEQGEPRGIGLLDAFEAFEPIANPFDGLFDSFSPSVLAFFVNISQFFGPPMG